MDAELIAVGGSLSGTRFPLGASTIRAGRIPGGSVCRFHGGAAPQVKAAAQARLRAMVDPALGVLEYAMKRKDKDLRGALAAAPEFRS
jgi:hypothetical protein